MVLNNTYNFSIDTELEKWLFLDLTASICAKTDFSQKVFKIQGSNFPEMFIGSSEVLRSY